MEYFIVVVRSNVLLLATLLVALSGKAERYNDLAIDEAWLCLFVGGI